MNGRNYRPKHVELIEIVNKIIIVASSRLFMLLYQWRTVTETSSEGPSLVPIRSTSTLCVCGGGLDNRRCLSWLMALQFTNFLSGNLVYFFFNCIVSVAGHSHGVYFQLSECDKLCF